MTYDITAFVKEALEKKIPRAEISAALTRAGWSAEEAQTALSAFAEIDFPLPVPRRKPYLSAREAFIYLLLFFCLYLSAISVGTLLFHFVNRIIPDVLKPYELTDLSGVRFSTAAVIIAFPIYLWLSLILARAIAKRPEEKNSKIRKWLTYITLFLAAGVIIGDLIALLFNLFQGDLTTRFVLKVLVVLAIAGAIFGYYLWDLRKEEKT
jgi:hypothetical protein